jgi:hypothetical protein
MPVKLAFDEQTVDDQIAVRPGGIELRSLELWKVGRLDRHSHTIRSNDLECVATIDQEQSRRRCCI